MEGVAIVSGGEDDVDAAVPVPVPVPVPFPDTEAMVLDGGREEARSDSVNGEVRMSDICNGAGEDEWVLPSPGVAGLLLDVLVGTGYDGIPGTEAGDIDDRCEPV